MTLQSRCVASGYSGNERRLNIHLRTEVCDLLGCDYPIVLAGMGGVARSELALAVTKAGGFGFLGMVREPPGLIRNEVEAMRLRTSKPFGVNIIPAAAEPELLEGEVETCIELQLRVMALFWSLRADLVRRFRDAGIVVVYQVGSTPLRMLLSELVPTCATPSACRRRHGRRPGSGRSPPARRPRHRDGHRIPRHS